MPRFSVQWSRFTVLPNIHSFRHTFTHRRWCQPRKASATPSGAVMVSDSLRDTSTLEPGIELATFQIPANPLYLLSHMPTYNKSFILLYFLCEFMKTVLLCVEIRYVVERKSCSISKEQRSLVLEYHPKGYVFCQM